MSHALRNGAPYGVWGFRRSPRTITRVSSHARTERAQLCTLFEQVGPDHPTLCTGWTCYDLAAHLVLRERRPDAAPGILIKGLAGRTRSVQRQLRASHTFAELVGLLRDGPPRWSPYAVHAVDESANTVEFFVHHEDVRRAAEGWQPRELDPGLTEALWSRLRRGGRLFFRRAPVGVALHRPDTGATIQVRDGEPAAVISGPPAELLMYAFGRRSHANVTLGGDPAAVQRLTRTTLGL